MKRIAMIVGLLGVVCVMSAQSMHVIYTLTTKEDVVEIISEGNVEDVFAGIDTDEIIHIHHYLFNREKERDEYLYVLIQSYESQYELIRDPVYMTNSDGNVYMIVSVYTKKE